MIFNEHQALAFYTAAKAAHLAGGLLELHFSTDQRGLPLQRSYQFGYKSLDGKFYVTERARTSFELDQPVEQYNTLADFARAYSIPTGAPMIESEELSDDTSYLITRLLSNQFQYSHQEFTTKLSAITRKDRQ